MTCLTILGIDPGLRQTGFAVAEVSSATRKITAVHKIGVSMTEITKQLKVRKTSDDLSRAHAHAELLKALVADFDVDIIAYEMGSKTKYTYPTFSFGVMMGVVAALGLPIIELLPYEIKKAVTGDRHATKKKMITWAMKATTDFDLDWPLTPKKNHMGLTYHNRHVALAAEHPADALAAVQAAITSPQFRLAAAIARR